jgi:MFS family permease
MNDPRIRKWAIVGILHLTQALVGTMGTAKGIFFPSLIQAFRLSHAAGAALVSTSIVVGAVASLAGGWLLVRHGRAQWLIAAATLVAGSGYVIAAEARSYDELLLAYALLGSMMTLLIAAPFVIANWFPRGRALALAIVFAGTTTGGVLLNPVLAYIVGHWGWRVGYGSLAVAILVPLPALLLWIVRTAPSQTESAPDPAIAERHAAPGAVLAEALRSRAFWLILFSYFVFGAHTNAYFTHFIAAMNSLGYETTAAAWLMSVLFLLAAATKLIYGYTADRVSVRAALSLSMLMSAAGLFLLGSRSGQASLYVFIVTYGLSYSAPLVLLPILIAEVFGTRNFPVVGAAIGVLGNIAGGFAGPVFAGWVFDVTGSYGIAFVVFAAALVLSSVSILIVSQRKSAGRLAVAVPG